MKGWGSKLWRFLVRALVGVIALLVCATSSESDARADDDFGALRVRMHVLELDLDKAKRILDATTDQDTSLAIERGRYHLYATEYERAVEVLNRPDVLQTNEGGRLAQLAQSCWRSMAGAFTVVDAYQGIVIRMQDDHDLAIAPLITEVAAQAREALFRDLGVSLPRPLRIELVRDHFALSAMTGLPEEAARTTGTVAVANWGRVAMISPRPIVGGYPWMDTLAHELTHLVLGRGTRDKAPLWMQEGLAKVEESRWRDRNETDDQPSPDVIAAVGFDLGLGRPFDELGPSVAMLPSAQQAMVVFAQLQSFMRYWIGQAGPQALVSLVASMREAPESVGTSEQIRQVSGKDLGAWYEQWKHFVLTLPRELPQDVGLKAPAGHGELQALAWKTGRLGKLLLERGHLQVASTYLEKARDASPSDSNVRYLLARAYLGLHRDDVAREQVMQLPNGTQVCALAYAMRGFFLGTPEDTKEARFAFWKALSTDPWQEEVACEMQVAPSLPRDFERIGLCEAARMWPRN